MKTIAFLIALFCAASAAAEDMTAPVKEIMAAAASNWSGGDSDWIDIFDESRLTRLYSKDFVARYRAAAENPAVDEDGISPFDYDVIVNAQDACPLKDIVIKPGPPAGEATEIDVTFKKATCMDDPALRDAVTTDRFLVILENGRPVIDDIVTEGDPGQPPNRLKATMDLIAKGQ